MLAHWPKLKDIKLFLYLNSVNFSMEWRQLSQCGLSCLRLSDGWWWFLISHHHRNNTWENLEICIQVVGDNSYNENLLVLEDTTTHQYPGWTFLFLSCCHVDVGCQDASLAVKIKCVSAVNSQVWRLDKSTFSYFKNLLSFYPNLIFFRGNYFLWSWN